MFLVKPSGKKKKWDIRFRMDGRTFKVPGDRDKHATNRIAERLKMLVAAKQNGDLPPSELSQWMANMPQSLAERLSELGLLDQRRREQRRPLLEHIKDFQAIVAARRSNTEDHAKSQAGRVRRLVTAMEVTHFSEITADGITLGAKVLEHGGKSVSVATRHHHLRAMKNFCRWMVASKRALQNPAEHVELPSPDEDPQIERRPLTVAEFQALMAYLTTFERYPHQLSKWTAADRRLVYWLAVKTGFRKNELATLRRADFQLDSKPPRVVVQARHAKSGEKASVPIPNDLAASLGAYTDHMHPEAQVFRFPTCCHSVVDILRRDLRGAGITWNEDKDSAETIDFHTLRSTAITWWLTEDRLHPKAVQQLARVTSLALVERYSRNWVMKDYSWLNKGKVLDVAPVKKAKSA